MNEPDPVLEEAARAARLDAELDAARPTDEPGPPISKDMALQISRTLGEGEIDPATVERVLAAWSEVQAGDPLGMVRRDAEGNVAHRIERNGYQQWVCSNPQGETWFDLQPRLSWAPIYTP